MESDEEIRRVPEFGIGSGGQSTSGRGAASAGPDKAQSSTQPGQKRKGRSPADKEHKRLKRSHEFIVFFSFFNSNSVREFSFLKLKHDQRITYYTTCKRRCSLVTDGVDM